MANKPYRIIIDTNLWISFLIIKNYSGLKEILFSGRITLLFSKELLYEFMDVCKRPKFQKYFLKEDMEEILKAMDEFGEVIEVSSKITACRDLKDNFLLSLAFDGKADYLITGDSDLVVIKKFGKCKIVKYSEFEAAL